jgi:hypothetical protein
VTPMDRRGGYTRTAQLAFQLVVRFALRHRVELLNRSPVLGAAVERIRTEGVERSTVQGHLVSTAPGPSTARTSRPVKRNAHSGHVGTISAM